MTIRSLLAACPLAVVLSMLPAQAGEKAERKSEKELSQEQKRSRKEAVKATKHLEVDMPSDKEWKRRTEGHQPQDKNGDGVINRQEWPGNDESFRELDRDKDGLLTDRDRQYQVPNEAPKSKTRERRR